MSNSGGFPLTELKDLRKKSLDNPVMTLIGILLSIGVMLLFMYLLRSVGEGIKNTMANFVSLVISVIVLANVTGLRKVVGEGVVTKLVIMALVIAGASLLFSRYFVYDRYLEGLYGHLSHTEHDLMYSQMQIISNRLSNGYSIAQATEDLYLNQYHNIFVYCSMIFLVGGVNLTNMIVWSTLHLVICAVCMVLMCYQFGITDRTRLNLIFTLSLCQPLFWMVHNYNKVVIGQAFFMVGMYIYMVSFRKPLLNMALFPVYAWLMWTMRLQYLLIAVALCLWCIVVSNKKASLAIAFEVAAILAVLLFLFTTMNVGSFIQEELNVENYTDGYNYSLTAIPMRIIRSFIPYFPFTNIFADDNWAFNIYCLPQIALNLVLWYMVISRAIIKRRVKALFQNPMIVAAMGLFLAGGLSMIHTTYLSVGSFFLASELDEEIDGHKVLLSCVFTFMIIMFISVIYFSLGLAGSGSSGLDLKK